MEILILKTNISSNYEFNSVKTGLFGSFNIQECTIDLEDKDKVDYKKIGEDLNMDSVNSQIGLMGYESEELED